MNVLLWFVQVALTFLFLSGGAFKIMQYEELAKTPSGAALPASVWTVIGAVEILGALLLVIPAATKRLPVLTPIAAGLLALESFALAAHHARFSTEIAITNAMAWSVVMALFAAFVAYGRFKLKPITK